MNPFRQGICLSSVDILFNEGAIFAKLLSLAIIIQTVAVVLWDLPQCTLALVR